MDHGAVDCNWDVYKGGQVGVRLSSYTKGTILTAIAG